MKLRFFSFIAFTTLVFWVCYFKVQDSDFWWHIKAGEVMLQTGWLITLDPFAHMREGMPYLATHEWLAQILLYGAFAIFGSLGIIGLRFVTAVIAFGSSLFLDRTHLWPHVFLSSLAVVLSRQGLIERPQIFSNAIFASVLIIGFFLLDLRRAQFAPHVRLQWLTLGLILLQVLWVNMHGGAAFLSLIVPAFLLLQDIVDKRKLTGSMLGFPVLLGTLLLIAMMISPNGFHNITYVWLLFTDKTAQFIQEWSPHPWAYYLSHFGIFWVLSLGAILWTRKNVAASLLLLCSLGYLSRSAARHEVLFVISALTITFYQLKHNTQWQLFLDVVLKKPWKRIAISLVATALLLLINQPFHAFAIRNNVYGSGTLERGKGAFDFLVKRDIRGPMFNTYSLGGYLLYRGYPDRKVYLDGRNVDYGYEYIKSSLDAREDKAVFDRLITACACTHLVIEYTAGLKPGEGPEYLFLNTHSDWALVYIDDSVAVYVRRLPEFADLIAEREYTTVTPEGLLLGIQITDGSPRGVQRLTKELLQASRDTDTGIRALVSLASLLLVQNDTQKALALTAEAQKRSPYGYAPQIMFSKIYEAQNEFAQAAAAYEQAIELAQQAGVPLDHGHLADLYEKAGDAKNAQINRRRQEAQ